MSSAWIGKHVHWQLLLVLCKCLSICQGGRQAVISSHHKMHTSSFPKSPDNSQPETQTPGALQSQKLLSSYGESNKQKQHKNCSKQLCYQNTNKLGNKLICSDS